MFVFISAPEVRGVATGEVYGYIYTPKISTSKLLWGRNDVRTAVEHDWVLKFKTSSKIFIPPKTNFWLRPCQKFSFQMHRERKSDTRYPAPIYIVPVCGPCQTTTSTRLIRRADSLFVLIWTWETNWPINWTSLQSSRGSVYGDRKRCRKVDNRALRRVHRTIVSCSNPIWTSQCESDWPSRSVGLNPQSIRPTVRLRHWDGLYRAGQFDCRCSILNVDSVTIRFRSIPSLFWSVRNKRNVCSADRFYNLLFVSWCIVRKTVLSHIKISNRKLTNTKITIKPCYRRETERCRCRFQYVGT